MIAILIPEQNSSSSHWWCIPHKLDHSFIITVNMSDTCLHLNNIKVNKKPLNYLIVASFVHVNEVCVTV